jgi:hypothetical protein
MSNELSNLVKLKQIELEIAMMIRKYENTLFTYNKQIRTGDKSGAIKSMKIMDKVNTTFKTLTAQGGKLLKNIIAEGTVDQEIIAEKRRLLLEANNALQIQLRALAQMEADISDIDGELESSDMAQKTNHFQYVFAFIIAIIMSALVVTAISTKESNGIEKAIAIGAIITGLYMLIQRFL